MGHRSRSRVSDRCAYCGGPKKTPDTKHIPRHFYELDPYCSRLCKELDLGIRAPADDEAIAGTRTNT